MNKTTKIWLRIAAVLVLIGCIIWGGVMSALKWDFLNLSTVKFETNQYEIQGNYQNIAIVTDTADITFVPSENEKHTVICHEQKNMKHSVSVNDGTLTIEIKDTRKWYEFIGIHFNTPKITVYLPQGEYGALSVKSSTGEVKIPKDFTFNNIDILESTGEVTILSSVLDTAKITASTGNIHVENITAGALELSVSTGRVTVSDVNCAGDISLKVSTGKARLTNIACQNLASTGNTGDINLQNVIAAGSLSLKRSTGNIELKGCDAATIYLKTDTGDVEGTLRSEKVFLTQTDTGDVDVPKTTAGGKCEIRTNTGDIEIEIAR